MFSRKGTPDYGACRSLGAPGHPVPAEVVGVFMESLLADGRRLAYCERCARLLQAGGYFTPDPVQPKRFRNPGR